MVLMSQRYSSYGTHVSEILTRLMVLMSQTYSSYGTHVSEIFVLWYSCIKYIRLAESEYHLAPLFYATDLVQAGGRHNIAFGNCETRQMAREWIDEVHGLQDRLLGPGRLTVLPFFISDDWEQHGERFASGTSDTSSTSDTWDCKSDVCCLVRLTKE